MSFDALLHTSARYSKFLLIRLTQQTPMGCGMGLPMAQSARVERRTSFFSAGQSGKAEFGADAHTQPSQIRVTLEPVGVAGRDVLTACVSQDCGAAPNWRKANAIGRHRRRSAPDNTVNP